MHTGAMSLIRPLLLLLLSMWLGESLQAQGKAVLTSPEAVYNFGTIAESDGLASHLFSINNSGEEPLVINRITVSCGCTQPEWNKAPILPGKSSEVKVTFNPKGRPGPFYKTVSVFSNGNKGGYTLAIKGNVTPKPSTPIVSYPYLIGDLKLTNKSVLYNTIRPDEVLGERIGVLNDGAVPLTLHLGKSPDYLSVQANPATLAPGEAGEITLLLDAKAAKRRGQVSTEVALRIADTGKKEENGILRVTANLIDNFTKLSPSEKAQAPTALLSGTVLDFAKLEGSKGGILPILKAKATGTFDITNRGKSKLAIYSVTSDSPLLDISGGKREIKPGETTTFKVVVRPNEIKTRLETTISIVCNDPDGPVRLIKVTAHK